MRLGTGSLIFSIVVLWLAVPSAGFSDSIILKSGIRVKGEIIRQDEEDVFLKSPSGMTHKIKTSEIESITPDQSTGQPPALAEKPMASRLSSGRPVPPGTKPAVPGKPMSGEDIFNIISPSTVVIRAELANGASQGSGFVLDSNGVIATNYHVIAGAKAISVKTYDNKIYPVTGLIQIRPLRDLAVLKIEARDLPVADLGISQTLRKGETLFVIGAPLGLEYSVTNGIFSGLRWDKAHSLLQFSAASSPGNSGGPLVNTQAQVIGIVSQCLVDGQNLNLAIPVDQVRTYLKPADLLMTMEQYVAATPDLENFMALIKGLNPPDLLASLIRLVNSYPTLSEGWEALTELYLSMDQNDLALDAIHKGLVRDPNNAALLDELAIVQYQKEEFAGAELSGSRALAQDPDNMFILGHMGSIYEKTDKLDLAEAALRKEIANKGSAESYNNLGYVLMRQDKDAEALQTLKYSISMKPDNIKTHMNLITLHYKLKNFPAAIEAAKKVYSLGTEPGQDWRKKLRPYETEDSVIPPDNNVLWNAIESHVNPKVIEIINSYDPNKHNTQDLYFTMKKALPICGRINHSECAALYLKSLFIGSSIINKTVENLKINQGQTAFCADGSPDRKFIDDFNRFMDTNGGMKQALEYYQMIFPYESPANYSYVQANILALGYLALGACATMTKNEKNYSISLHQLRKAGLLKLVGFLKEMAANAQWNPEVETKKIFPWPLK